MAIDLGPLSGAMSTVSNISSLVMVSPQGNTGYRAQNDTSNKLEDSILFHYESENTATLTSDITDHIVEDNSVINDHIGLRPEIITVGGFIGELNDVVPPKVAVLRTAKEKLINLSIYTPELTLDALRLYNVADRAYRTAINAKDNITKTIDSLSDGGAFNEVDSNGLTTTGKIQNKQQIAFQKFYTYWRDRKLFTIQTPWAIFKNMAIQSLRVSQGEQTDVISDFEITFKLLRFADSSQSTLKPIRELKSQNAFSDTVFKSPESGFTSSLPSSSNYT